MNNLYPLFLNLAGKKCLVVGGGGVAGRKVRSLLECEADVTVISPDISENIKELVSEGKIRCNERSYRAGDVRECFLVIVATDDKEVNKSVSEEAKGLGILYNIVDVPALCNFFVPSIVKIGDLKIAISTNGKSPALAKKLRIELEKTYGSEYAVFLERLGQIREKLINDMGMDQKKREEILNNIINSDALQYLENGDEEKYNNEIEKWISR